MPYDTIEELPSQVRSNLPEQAQDIFKEAFNHAWQQYQDEEKRKGNDSLEVVANKVAWSAVKKKYKKKNGEWVKK